MSSNEVTQRSSIFHRCIYTQPTNIFRTVSSKVYNFVEPFIGVKEWKCTRQNTDNTTRKRNRQTQRERERERERINEWYKWREYLSQGENRENSRSSWIGTDRWPRSFVTRSTFGQLSSHVLSRDVASKESRNDRPELETWPLHSDLFVLSPPESVS